jgi:hypothetical protein
MRTLTYLFFLLCLGLLLLWVDLGRWFASKFRRKALLHETNLEGANVKS